MKKIDEDLIDQMNNNQALNHLAKDLNNPSCVIYSNNQAWKNSEYEKMDIVCSFREMKLADTTSTATAEKVIAKSLGHTYSTARTGPDAYDQNGLGVEYKINHMGYNARTDSGKLSKVEGTGTFNDVNIKCPQKMETLFSSSIKYRLFHGGMIGHSLIFIAEIPTTDKNFQYDLRESLEKSKAKRPCAKYKMSSWVHNENTTFPFIDEEAFDAYSYRLAAGIRSRLRYESRNR